MHLRIRIAFLLYSISLWILVDEYIKEGYVLDPHDFITPAITHEKIWLALLIASVILGLGKRLRR